MEEPLAFLLKIWYYIKRINIGVILLKIPKGNFVIYNSDQDVIWESFDYPTDTLLPGQRLLAGQELISSMSDTHHSSGIFRLKMQTDGNLVQYPVDTPDTAPYSFYTSWTGGSTWR